MSDTATDPNKEYVNGPINVVRLEGNIGNVKKVMYLMMDIHNPCAMQTKCENIFSTDVDKYLADSFYDLNKADHKYDFFLEIFPTEILNVKYGYPFNMKFNMNDIYIQEVWKLFVKTFAMDKDKKTVKQPDIFQNVRLHYADIRAFFDLDDFYNFRTASRIIGSFWESGFNEDSIRRVIEILSTAKEHYLQLVNVYTELKKDKKFKIPTPKIIGPPEKNEEGNPIIHIAYLLRKITTKYSHKEIQKKLVSYLENHLEKITGLVQDINELIDRIHKYSQGIADAEGTLVEQPDGLWNYDIPNNIIRNLLTDLINKTSNVYKDFVSFYANIMDMYFLRRFLDKDYITNGIAYTGAYHSVFYVYMLVKTFGFKITHTSYSKIKNIKELNKKVRTIKSELELNELLYPPKMDQCSDMTRFPKHFE